MTHAGLGTPRVDAAARRLRELNPHVTIETVAENISAANVERLVGSVDLVVDAAPLFQERFLLNAEAARQRKPLIESAMYELEAQLTTIVAGQTPCLRCLYPADPPGWHRRFPVFGAVAGTIGSLAAMEAIKVLARFGEPLLGKLLVCDLRDMTFRTIRLSRKPDCPVCGGPIPGTGD
jgi:molybdopterin/thiamine biosynthesis adenylyltransferase